MKHIKLFSTVIFLFLFSASLHAQTKAEMIARSKEIIAAMQTKGYDLRDAMIYSKYQFPEGFANKIYKLYPMNNYKIIIADDGKRNSQLQLEAIAAYNKEKMDKTIKFFEQGAHPESVKSELTSGYIEQDILMRAVLKPVNYKMQFTMAKKDIKEDSKFLFMTFYKSTEHIQGNTTKNDLEQYYHQEIEKVLKEREQSSQQQKPAATNAQSDAMMNAVAQRIEQEMAKKGYSLSNHTILPVNEFNQGYNTRFFPGNYYQVCLSDDLVQKANIQMSAKAEYDQAEVNAIFREFKIGKSPKNIKMVKGASIIFQELSLKDVIIPVDYDFEFKMEEKDIQSDSKVNLLVFYKSVKNTSNDSKKNKAEDYSHQQFQQLQKRAAAHKIAEANKPKLSDAKTRLDSIKFKAAEKGFSLARVEKLTAGDLSKKTAINLKGGNTYLIGILHGSSTNVSFKGIPDEKYNLLASMTEGMDELQPFSFKPSNNYSLHKIDLRSSIHSPYYTLEPNLQQVNRSLNTSILIFYKSFENLGGPENNKAEDFYSKKAAEAMISAVEEGIKDFEKAMGYEFRSLEELIEETKTLTPQAPSGMKLETAKAALNIWKDAMVVESKGKSYSKSVFKIMDTDWQSDFYKYKNNHTVEKIIHELKGAFSYRGFTKDGLFVVDHVMDEKVKARYYFKFPKNKKYGGIIPKHEIKDGKIHLIAWQKAVVPN